jgi:hypothetical protein
MGTETERQGQRHAKRWISRIGLGAGLGAILGVMIGATWGLMVYRVGSLAMWGVLIACTLFLSGVGALVGGMSGLESPDPGREPSQFADPVHEPSGLTREEQPPEGSPPAR